MGDMVVRPEPAHLHLLQLSRRDFLRALADGLPMIVENAESAWNEANEIYRQLGRRRSVGVMQAIAEEESGKALLLFDAVRCPVRRADDFRRLVRQFNQHLAKAICADYYNTCPHNLEEVEAIVNRERQLFYREGEYGEFIAPNRLLHFRERRLYVDYFRDADGTCRWVEPYPPDALFGDPVPFTAIRLAGALMRLNVFSGQAVLAAHRYWSQIEPEEIERRGLLECNIGMFEDLERNGIEYQQEHQEAIRLVCQSLLYPLYPFDLRPLDNFAELPPPENPGAF